MHRTLVKTFRKIVRKVSKHGRLILTVTSIVGLGESVYITAKVAPKAKEALMEARKVKGEDLTLTEKAKIAAPIYIPAAISTACTAGLILFNHKLGSKKLEKAMAAAIAARRAYIELSKDFVDYRKTLEDEYSLEVATEVENMFYDKKAKKALEHINVKDADDFVKNAPGSRNKDSLLCWMPDNGIGTDGPGTFFWASEQELGDAEGKFNKQLQEANAVGLDTYRAYFDFPIEKDYKEYGYNMACECWGYDRENSWVRIYHTRGKIGDIDCYIIQFDRAGLCSNWRTGCSGEPLPFM